MKFMRSVCVFVCVKLTQFGSAFRREVSLWPTPLPLYHHSSSIPNYRGVHSRISHVSVLDSLINLTVCSYLKMLTNKCEHFNICTNNLLSLTDTYYDFSSYPTSCMAGQWARLAATAHSSDVPTEVRLTHHPRNRNTWTHDTIQSTIMFVTLKTAGRFSEPHRILVRFFRHIIALDRLTDPSGPTRFSERLQKTYISHKKLRAKFDKCITCQITLCVWLTPAQWCVSAMAKQEPSWQQWHHPGCSWTHCKTKQLGHHCILCIPLFVQSTYSAKMQDCSYSSATVTML